MPKRSYIFQHRQFDFIGDVFCPIFFYGWFITFWRSVRNEIAPVLCDLPFVIYDFAACCVKLCLWPVRKKEKSMSFQAPEKSFSRISLLHYNASKAENISMRKWIRLILLMTLAFGIYKSASAQTAPAPVAEPDDGPAADPVEPEPTPAATTPDTVDLTGFDGFRWGDTYEEVRSGINDLIRSGRSSIPVEKISDIPEREIRIRRGNVIYRYVFYKRPEILKKLDGPSTTTPAATPDATDDIGPDMDPDNPPADAQPADRARLFLVESTFAYIEADQVYGKLSKKYGNRTTTTETKEFRGAYIWDLESGRVIQWLDPYNEKPYTRSIYYYSLAITKEIMADLKEYNYVEEIKTMMDLLP